MHSTLNLATRRLLQVVLDVLSNPLYAEKMAEREAAIEAAWRAANEAKGMLEAAHEPALPIMPSPMIPGFPGIPPVTCEPNTGRKFNYTKITCGGGAQ